MVDFSTISQDPADSGARCRRTSSSARSATRSTRGCCSAARRSRRCGRCNVGDTMVFTGAGLISRQMTPLVPGTDPTPQKFWSEQWTAQIQQYAGAIDTHMPTSIAAIANLFLRNAQQLGLSAAQSLNRITRNRLYNTAVWVRPSRTARKGRPQPSGRASQRLHPHSGGRTCRPARRCRSTAVSNNNPLPVTINTGTLSVPMITSANVIGYTADNSGDEVGPGTVTLDTVHHGRRSLLVAIEPPQLSHRAWVAAIRSTTSGRTDLLTFSAVDSAVARLWTQNVPEQPDGRFHCHLDPTSQAQIFSDPEFQRINTSLPDYYMYRQFALGEILNTVFYRNSENPLPETVISGATATFSKIAIPSLASCGTTATPRPASVCTARSSSRKRRCSSTARPPRYHHRGRRHRQDRRAEDHEQRDRGVQRSHSADHPRAAQSSARQGFDGLEVHRRLAGAHRWRDRRRG